MLRRCLAVAGILFILCVQRSEAEITLGSVKLFMHDWAIECLVERYSVVWCKQLGQKMHPELANLRPYYLFMDSIYHGMKAVTTADQLQLLRQQQQLATSTSSTTEE
jgi:hypothetical protein